MAISRKENIGDRTLWCDTPATLQQCQKRQQGSPCPGSSQKGLPGPDFSSFPPENYSQTRW